MSRLTGDDLARPAKDLPLKAIRTLGHMLHRAQYNSGNWETIAEDLGYEYEDIKNFKTMADVRQESPPGELMLRDWAQRLNGCTLFVLHSSLVKAERLDCVDYLDAEIYKRVVCMDLRVCVKYEDCKPADHMCVSTRADANLLDSLQNHLEQPLSHRYKLLDHGVSWNGTRAREFKGRQLMLLKTSEEVQMEQDPTIDSSGLGLTGMDQTESTILKNSPDLTSYLRTSQNNTTDTRSLTGTNFQQELRRVSESGLNVGSGGHLSYHHNQAGLSSYGIPVPNTNSDTVLSNFQNISSSQILHNQSGSRPTLNRQVLPSNDQALREREDNNLDIISKRRELKTSCQNLNISNEKIDKVANRNAVAKSCQNCCFNKINPKNGDALGVRKLSDDREPCEHSETYEYRGFSEYKDAEEYRDFGEYRDSGEYRDPNRYRDAGEYRDSSEFRVSGEYRDPNEYRDDNEYRDHNRYRDAGEYRDTSEYRDPNKYRDPNQYRHAGEYRETSELRVSGEYRDPNQNRDDSDKYRDPSEYRDPNKYRNPNNSGRSSNGGIRFISQSFETSSILHTDTELRQIETLKEQENRDGHHDETTDPFEIKEYQYASDDSVTFAKQTNCSRELKENSQPNNDPGITFSIKFTSSNSSEFSFDSGTYNTQPESQRKIDSVEDGHAHMCLDDDNNGEASFPKNLEGQLDKGINENTDEGRFYLDFNKYDQGCSNANLDTLRENLEEVNCEENVFKVPPARTQHKPPKRFVSEMIRHPASKSGDRKMYESLQRGLSCPSEIIYEKSMVFQEEHEMITIADVFSPVTEESKINDFETLTSMEIKSSVNPENFDRSGSPSPKRHSLPMVRPCQNVKRTKFLRHTFQNGDKVVRFNDSPVEDISRTWQGSPKLPPRGSLPPLPCDDLSRCTSKDSNFSMRSEVAAAGVSKHCCKIVVGAKSSRPALDGLLADDKLFTHYNSTLSSFPGWSSRETENTVEKTMADAQTSDGYYILWYIRSRKNLVISVSFRGSLVHYRVHTKVLSSELHYYITQGRYFDDIIQMLHHYLKYGVRAPADVRGGSSRTHEYRIPLRCPVLVQYEPRPAISV